MTDTFHFRPEVSRGALQRPRPEDLSTYGFLPHPEDLRDYRSETYHMVILEKLPAATTNHRFRAVTNHAATPGCSTQTPIYGNEVSQSVRYWERMQTPQLISPEQSGGICPCPTRLPSGPNATSEPHARGPFEVVSTESRGYPFPTAFSQHKNSLRFPVATTPAAALLLMSDSSPEGSQRTRFGFELVRSLSPLLHTEGVDVSLSRPLPDQRCN